MGLGFAGLAGIAGLAVQSIAGGRTIYGSLWLLVAGLLVVGGWLFGRQEDHLHRLSVTDSLTGLANRRELERRMGQELARAFRHRLPLSLVLIDVDLLKQINDRGGHRAGDRALLAVAAALHGCCRSIDIAARVGGDEFAILAPTTSARDAVALAERIQASLRTASTAGGEPVSVSIGIADLDSAAELGVDRDLREAADRALYRAKTSGRDCIAMHGGDGPVEGNAAGANAAAAAQRVMPTPLRVLPGGIR